LNSFVLALLASSCWGVSDFLGGLNTRFVNVALVLSLSQVAGMVVLLSALAVHGEALVPDGRLVLSLGAGMASLASLGLLYSAMARGTMAVVAPIAASGALVPVAVGAVRGDAIGAIGWSGIVLTLAGALGASWQPGGENNRGRLIAGGLLAMGAAVMVGLFFTLLDVASEADPFWAATLARGAATVASLVFLATRWRSARTSRLTGGTLLGVAAVGFADAAAEILFAASSVHGEVGIVAVLSSVYPVVTAALAIVLLRERVHWRQALAAGGAVLGVVLLGYASAN
jgi:drug/metabolite transporter (DMT)-like permease